MPKARGSEGGLVLRFFRWSAGKTFGSGDDCMSVPGDEVGELTPGISTSDSGLRLLSCRLRLKPVVSTCAVQITELPMSREQSRRVRMITDVEFVSQ